MVPMTYQAALQEPLLEFEQERDAIRKWQEQGDRKALELLVTSHARQAWSQAVRWSNNPVHLEDLAAEGMIGLMRAADNFDLKQKVRFSTYSLWWVMSCISAALSKIKIVIDMPTRTYMDACGGRRSDEKHLQAQMALRGIIALDAPLGKAGASATESLHSPEGTPEEKILRKSSSARLSNLLQEALQSLKPQEAEIIRRLKLHSDPASIKALAAEMNLTPSRLRQLESHALMRLRRALLSQGFHLTMLD